MNSSLSRSPFAVRRALAIRMTTLHKIKWFTLSVIAALFFVAAVQNTGVTQIQFMGWETEAPRVLLILGVGLGGFVAGILAVLLIQRHQGRLHPRSGESATRDSSYET